MLTVHHLNNSRSFRIIWLLEELGVEYQIINYSRDKKTLLAPPEYLKLHPVGTAPVITDGDLVLAESGAIIEVILEKYGKDRLIPSKGSPEWVQFIYWLHFAEGSLMPLTLLKFVFERIYQRSPFLIKPITGIIRKQLSSQFIQPRLRRQLHYIESTFERSQWLAGSEFTAADIQVGVSIIMGGLQNYTDSSRPKIKEFVTRIESRPAYQRSLEIAGPPQLNLVNTKN